ncbi:MAG: zinc ribbon domain-containing protein [Desulfobacteraceae bacterium]|nr:zinc ribbon domain-containing protein [Desulfobacteraceae bacterium]
MAFETKEQVLEKVMTMERPVCPHCKKQMDIWEAPPINFADGLGWGAPYLFLCFNDECPLYVNGWDNLKENYAHNASYRCFCYPGEDHYECMPVFSPMGAKGQIINEQVMAQQEVLKDNIKKGFSILADCYINQDGVSVLRLLLDPSEPMRVRTKAAEMMGDIGGIEAIDALRNLRVGNDILEKKIETAVQEIHTRHFTRECPYCAEIIKKKAKLCKHCGKDVAGQ